MGIEPILVSDAVDLVIAQRLMRKICPNCKKETDIPSALLERLEMKNGVSGKFYHGTAATTATGRATKAGRR